MRHEQARKETLQHLQTQAARKLAEIHQMLAPGMLAPANEDELRRAADDHMARLSPGEREKLRMKAIVAYSQLDRLMKEMSEHLAEIGDELKRVNRQSRAVTAYSQISRMTRHGSAAM
jgi:hypothetical protein